MSLRTWLEKNTAAATGIAVAILVLAGILIVFQLRVGRAARPEAWFYDVGTKQLFTAPLLAVPPIEAPSGAKLADGGAGGVKAHVLSCGECSDTRSRFTAYLERLTPEAKALVAESRGPGKERAAASPPPDFQGSAAAYREVSINAGRLIANPDQPEAWHSSSSEEGQTLVREARQRCDGGRLAKECFP